MQRPMDATCVECVTKDGETFIGSRSCAANDDVTLLGFQV